jgi:hypothetical protein
MHPTRIFKHESELADAWARYKEDLREQAKEWVKIQYVGKDGFRAEDPQKVPMTLEGFERFCYDHYGNVGQYFDNREERYNEYVTICKRIKRIIRQDQIEGGMVGQFNPSITQRLNSLTEKTDVTSQGEKINEIKVTIVSGNQSN